MWIKICGVKSVEAARAAEAAGADAIGINLHPPSPRYVEPALAAEIARSVEIEVVIVVVNRTLDELEELVAEICPDTVQLHGDEPTHFGRGLTERGVKVQHMRAHRAHPTVLEEIAEEAGERFLLDAFCETAHGGTGKRVDLDVARAAGALGPMILAGGLNSENVAEVIEAAAPHGVDVASGVESARGVQCLELIESFVKAARSAASR